MISNNTPAPTTQEAVRDAIRKAYDDGYNDAKIAPDNSSTYCVARAVDAGSTTLLSKLRTPAVQEAQPNMFWDASLPDKIYDTLDDAMFWAQGEYGLMQNDTVEIQQAIQLPALKILVTEGDEDGDIFEYKILKDNAAPQASDAARQQRTEDSLPSYLLSAEHVGMRVDYTGLFGWACDALKRGETAPAAAEMLRQLYIHLTELGQRWYSGDSAVVDELLQLYCIESDTRAALVAPPDSPIKENRVGANYGHGHVWERPDGLVTKCRGPGLCIICSDDKAQWQRRNREPRI